MVEVWIKMEKILVVDCKRKTKRSGGGGEEKAGRRGERVGERAKRGVFITPHPTKERPTIITLQTETRAEPHMHSTARGDSLCEKPFVHGR